jgi:hypothetical protein
MPHTILADAYTRHRVDSPLHSLKNDDPALVHWTIGNTTSEPLSSCEPCLRLIGDWGSEP